MCKATEGRQLLRQAADAGHEMANHSHNHPYALTRLSPERIAEEIAQAHEAITDATGQAPVGFRAPGYTINGRVIEAVRAAGYRYDSSAFPMLYYGAKATVMGLLRLLGKPSASVLDRPRVLLAPRAPYVPSRTEPYKKANAPLYGDIAPEPGTETQGQQGPWWKSPSQ